MMRRKAPRRRRMSALADEARCVVLLPARLVNPAPGGDIATITGESDYLLENCCI
jgi:hypothetical protein